MRIDLLQARSRRRRQSGLGLGLATVTLLLGACASRVDVRPMATGRSDVSAYELNGADVQRLRLEAQRLCPLGGEIVREAGNNLPPETDAKRWRSTLNTLAAWAAPPIRPAQMVVVCREGGDRYTLQAAVQPRTAPLQLASPTDALQTEPSPAALPGPAAAQTAQAARVAPVAQSANAPAGHVTAALPIGPIVPKW